MLLYTDIKLRAWSKTYESKKKKIKKYRNRAKLIPQNRLLLHSQYYGVYCFGAPYRPLDLYSSSLEQSTSLHNPVQVDFDKS